MKSLGKSVIALGAVSFLVALAKPCTIDAAALLLIWAGTSVCKGSRKGATVALIICVWWVFVAVAAAIQMVRGYHQIATWQGSTVIALGAWALVNAVLLACARPAASGEQGVAAPPSDGRPVLQFRLRSMLALMLAVAVVLGLCKWYAQWHEPPPFATVQAIEAKYSQQLARLRAVALETAPNRVDDPINVKLFSSDEIVSAEVGWISERAETPNVMMGLKERKVGQVRSSVTPVRLSPGIERPVAYLRYDQLGDSRSRRVVVYENQIIDKDGRKRALYRLELDLEGLHSVDGRGTSTNNDQQ